MNPHVRWMTFGVAYGNAALGDGSRYDTHPHLPFATGSGYVQIVVDTEYETENDLRLALHEALGHNHYAFLYLDDSTRPLKRENYPLGCIGVVHLFRHTAANGHALDYATWECMCKNPGLSSHPADTLGGRGCPAHTYGLPLYVKPEPEEEETDDAHAE